jgi:hypothetical protein
MEKSVRIGLAALLGAVLVLSVLTALQSRAIHKQGQQLATLTSQQRARVSLLETFHEEEIAVIDRRIGYED